MENGLCWGMPENLLPQALQFQCRRSHNGSGRFRDWFDLFRAYRNYSKLSNLTIGEEHPVFQCTLFDRAVEFILT